MPRFENATKEQVEEFVKQWLINEEYDPQPIKDDKTSFHYMIRKNNLELSVGQHKDSTDNIQIGGAIVFGENEKPMLRYLKIKRELLYELELVFASANLSFSTKYDTSMEEFTIEDIRLHKTIYYDALTNQTFYDGLNSIFSCLKLIIEKFNLLGRSSSNITP